MSSPITPSINKPDESHVFGQQDRFGRKRRVMSLFAVSLLRLNTERLHKQTEATRKVHTHGKRPRYI